MKIAPTPCTLAAPQPGHYTIPRRRHQPLHDLTPTPAPPRPDPTRPDPTRPHPRSYNTPTPIMQHPHPDPTTPPPRPYYTQTQPRPVNRIPGARLTSGFRRVDDTQVATEVLNLHQASHHFPISRAHLYPSGGALRRAPLHCFDIGTANELHRAIPQSGPSRQT
ncbi:hypothetical protein Pmani_027619 [Petrolisthes manimaculis]|uniref:Uncharacterized protein n=1 Tax=Petrolisthes manimaculis TaxID=1843537 RepID=A0AAE1P0Z9_9EUCA|nr:hypothetical protein Pmani_027619 [Petrolisthes manimaculis]